MAATTPSKSSLFLFVVVTLIPSLRSQSFNDNNNKNPNATFADHFSTLASTVMAAGCAPGRPRWSHGGPARRFLFLSFFFPFHSVERCFFVLAAATTTATTARRPVAASASPRPVRPAPAVLGHFHVFCCCCCCCCFLPTINEKPLW